MIVGQPVAVGPSTVGGDRVLAECAVYGTSACRCAMLRHLCPGCA